MSSISFRKFNEEMISIVGKRVDVETSEGKKYQGNLLGVDEKMDIILDNITGAGENVFKIIINGNFVKEIRLLEQPFELKLLAERLSRVFPGLVKVREEIGAIIVMDKIKVTENGVADGGGLAAERVKAVYNEFIKK